MRFYQKHWDVVGHDVTASVLDVLNNAASVCTINHTNIVLVPKKKGTCSTKDFRFINL